MTMTGREQQLERIYFFITPFYTCCVWGGSCESKFDYLRCLPRHYSSLLPSWRLRYGRIHVTETRRGLTGITGPTISCGHRWWRVMQHAIWSIDPILTMFSRYQLRNWSSPCGHRGKYQRRNGPISKHCILTYSLSLNSTSQTARMPNGTSWSSTPRPRHLRSRKRLTTSQRRDRILPSFWSTNMFVSPVTSRNLDTDKVGVIDCGAHQDQCRLVRRPIPRRAWDPE